MLATKVFSTWIRIGWGHATSQSKHSIEKNLIFDRDGNDTAKYDSKNIFLNVYDFLKSTWQHFFTESSL